MLILQVCPRESVAEEDVSGSASEAVSVRQYHRELVSVTVTEAVLETVSEGSECCRRGLQKQCHRDSVRNSVTEVVSKAASER